MAAWRIGIGAGIVAASLNFASLAMAADLGAGPAALPSPAYPVSGWSTSFTTYGWLTFLTGSSTVKGHTVDINVNPIQVLEHLERMPWFSYLELRNGRFSVYNDAMYAYLGASGSVAKTTPNATLGVRASIGFEQAIIETGVTYELYRVDSGGSFKDPLTAASFTAVDVIAGARYWYQSLDASFNLTVAADVDGIERVGTRGVARSGSVDWVDPLVGLRVRRQIVPGKEIVLRADVGGFDVGSKFSWNALAAYNFSVGTFAGLPLSGMVGYRALQADYAQGLGFARYEYNVIQHGPILGVTAKF